MSNKYLIIDGNSLGHFANNGAVLKLDTLEVQAIYGFLRTLRSFMALYSDSTPIVLWDGASWRKLMFPDYKNIRDKADTPNERKLLAKKEKYKAQAPYIKKALRLLGIPQVSALNMEADDLGAIMTDRYVKLGGSVVMLTGDQDWIQMVGPKAVWRDFAQKRMVTTKNFEEFTGVDTVQKFIEVKALSGDTGDSVPGVGGIGQKGAVEFVNKYGSFANFMEMVILEKTVDFKKLPKKHQNLVVDEGKAIAFKRNIELVDLRTTARPAPVNLVIDRGEPDFERFRKFCDILIFKSITQELEEWMRVFPHFTYLNEALA